MWPTIHGAHLARCIGCGGVSWFVHQYIQEQEQSAFEHQFHSDAQKILDSFGKSLDDTLGATYAFITKLTSYARSTNQSWPFVTMPYFYIHAAKLAKL